MHANNHEQGGVYGDKQPWFRKYGCGKAERNR